MTVILFVFLVKPNDHSQKQIMMEENLEKYLTKEAIIVLHREQLRKMKKESFLRSLILRFVLELLCYMRQANTIQHLL